METRRPVKEWSAAGAVLVDLLRDAYGAGDPRLEPFYVDDSMAVYRVDRASGASWVLRHFPVDRPQSRVDDDARVLAAISHLPVEQLVTAADGRLATAALGRGVIVTRFEAGPIAKPTRRVLRAVGAALADVHLVEDVPDVRAWFSPRANLAGARTRLEAVRDQVPAHLASDFDRIDRDLASTGDCASAPRTLVHPDCHLGNVIDSVRGPVLFDWEGAGRATAVASLGMLLYSTAVATWHDDESTFSPERVDLLLEGYLSRRPLAETEWSCLADAVRNRPIVAAAHVLANAVQSGAQEVPTGWWTAYGVADRVADHALRWR